MINFAELKKFFIWNFIGSLVIAALVAVATVLIGEFNEITGRVFLTLAVVVLHSLVSLLFIWDDAKRDTFRRLSFFVNTVFVIIVASFITCLFGIWKIIPSDMIWHFYQTYFFIGFGALHADILSKALRKENYMDVVIYANYGFIMLVILMLIPIIFIDNAATVLAPMYYRFLAAAGIIDGTLSILTIIFYKLHQHNHPELEVPSPGGAQKTGLHFGFWVWVLIIYVLFQVPWLFSLMFRGF